MSAPAKIGAILVVAVGAALAAAFLTRPANQPAPSSGPLAPQTAPLDLSAPPPAISTASSTNAPPPLTVNEPAIRGWVYDSRNLPVVDAAVTVYSVENGPRTAFTDSIGAFAVGDLARGEYRVSAVKSHFNEAVQDNVSAGSAGVTLILTDTSTAAGRVVDSQGKPIAKFDLVCIKQAIGEDALWKEIVRGKQTAWQSFEDDEGRFKLADIASGAPFSVGARAEGFEAAYVTVDAAEPGQPSAPVELALQAEARIAGVVLSPDHVPAPGAVVHLGTDEEGPVLAESDGSGSFELRGLGDSPIDLTASHDEYLAGTTTAHPLRGAVTAVEIVLGQGGELEGAVFQGDVPAQAQTVVALRLTPPRIRKQAVTDENGRYRISGIGLGLVDVLAKFKDPGSKSDPLRLQRQAEIVAGQTTTVDFHFPAGLATLEGSITANGAPVTFAEIQGTVTTDEGQSFFGSTARDDGYFRIEDIMPGTALVVVSARAGQAELRRTISVELAGGETARQDIAFDTASGVTGSVTNLAQGETGQVLALPGHVSVDTSSFEAIVALETLKIGESDLDANGQFSIGGLEPGPYTLVALVFSEHADTGDDALDSLRLAIATTAVSAAGEASVSLTLSP